MISHSQKIKKLPKLCSNKKMSTATTTDSTDSPSSSKSKINGFYVSPWSSEILNPFANFSFWPSHLKEILRDAHNELLEKSNLDPNGYEGNYCEGDSLELMKQVNMDQELMIEKWLWSKYQSTGENQDLQSFLLYRRAKGCIDIAFDDFFCRKQQEFKKPRFFFFFFCF